MELSLVSEQTDLMEHDPLTIGSSEFHSRLLLGTGKYGNLSQMQRAIELSGTEMVTMALRRIESHESQDGQNQQEQLLDFIPRSKQLENAACRPVHFMPNTSGARNAKEAILAAELARELLGTNFIKLEIHPDPWHLMPDPVETFHAAEKLVQKGFQVLPYIHADPVLGKRLEDVGVAALMPLGAPIGSNLGLRSRDFLEIIIQGTKLPVIVDAGIGSPSDAALAMELGADGVLISTAIATSADPVKMAVAFKKAVEAGRMAFLAGLGLKGQIGEGSSPLTDFLG